ncbi:chymotrypsin-like elastase family member 2A [Pecten maximus]|uniref:chymotrypsin-like elastase family member 2A n=1 Tax=Pecten maximus TaxID=6579 RepID=UPI0014586CFF|nr:chymotrypsin-like elastase family member 2A [Pecten maximus]
MYYKMSVVAVSIFTASVQETLHSMPVGLTLNKGVFPNMDRHSYLVAFIVLVLGCKANYVNSVDGIRRMERRLQKILTKEVDNALKRDETPLGMRREAVWTRMADTASHDTSNAGKAVKRVVGGTPMERDQWPWLVSLHFLRPIEFTEKTGMRHVCGGTIISTAPVWVLTAGHCFSEDAHVGFSNPNNWRVVIGEYNQYRMDAGEFIANIDEIHLHIETLQFIFRPLRNDIALLKLNPIPQLQLEDIADLDEGEFQPGHQCSVAGWGQVSYHPSGFGNFIPLMASVYLVDNDQCSDLYTASIPYTFYIAQSNICAGSDEGHDSCMGDSGGPLMCQSPEDNRWKLVGVVSTGYECGREDFPGIYTRVTYYQSWIDSVMGPSNGHLEV